MFKYNEVYGINCADNENCILNCSLPSLSLPGIRDCYSVWDLWWAGLPWARVPTLPAPETQHWQCVAAIRQCRLILLKHVRGTQSEYKMGSNMSILCSHLFWQSAYLARLNLSLIYTNDKSGAATFKFSHRCRNESAQGSKCYQFMFQWTLVPSKLWTLFFFTE